MPDEQAYQLTKAIFGHQDELLKIHKAARHTRPDNAVKNTPIPLHPGAVRCLKELGITVPDELVAR